jgi:SAM-dependent methyltransferase
MAIARAAAHLLVREAARVGFTGRLLQLGPQRLYLRAGELRRYAADAGLELPSGLRRAADGEPVSTEQFFLALGFDSVESCDLYDPAATYGFDLNEAPPADLRGAFDAVYDGGTMEHVFDTRRVLRTMHELLAPDGLAMHFAPSNNYVDHGFFMFSPLLFTSWYGVNGWDVEGAWLLEHSRRWRRGTWHATPYVPGMLDRRSMGGWERGSLLFLSIARKGPASTHDRVPQQGDDRTPGAAVGGLRRKLRSASSLLDEVVPTDVVRLRPRARLGARVRL